MKRLILLAVLTATAFAWKIGPMFTSRFYLWEGSGTVTAPYIRVTGDTLHYPYDGYLYLGGTDSTAGSLRIFNRERTGKSMMLRMVTANGRDTTKIDSLGVRTTGKLWGDGSELTGITGGDSNMYSDTSGVSKNSKLLQGKDTTALWNAKTLQTLDTAAIKSRSLAVGGTATNSALLQGKDTTALFNAKTLQTLDTTAIKSRSLAVGGTATNSALLQGKDTTWVKSRAGGVTAGEVSDSLDQFRTIVENDTSWITGSGETTGFVVHGDTWEYWGNGMVQDSRVRAFGSFYSIPVRDTCPTNGNLTVNLAASNTQLITLGATLCTLTVNGGADGQNARIVLFDTTAATAIVWKGDRSFFCPGDTFSLHGSKREVYSIITDAVLDAYYMVAVPGLGLVSP
jgi:hypothetical protein